MISQSSEPSVTPAIPAVPTNALDLWASEAAGGATPAQLALVKLNDSDKILIPFCTLLERSTVHYVEDPMFWSYVYCTGADCPLCRIGRHLDTRDLVPVYDPAARAIGVLAVSPSQTPAALRPQLMPVLQRVARGECPMMVVKKLDKLRFQVRASTIPPGADDGAASIKGFLADYEAGRVRMAEVFPRLSPAELAAIPTVANLLKFQGGGA